MDKEPLTLIHNHTTQPQLTTNLRIFIAAILAVRIAVALPAIENTPSTGFALKVRHRARQVAVLLVAAVSAIVRTIADRRRRRTVTVAALERSRSAVPCRARFRFVRFVLTIRFAVALPEPRNTLLVNAAAAMLTGGAIRDTGLRIPRQVELVRTSALIARSSLFDVAFDVQIGRLQWRCQQT